MAKFYLPEGINFFEYVIETKIDVKSNVYVKEFSLISLFYCFNFQF